MCWSHCFVKAAGYVTAAVFLASSSARAQQTSKDVMKTVLDRLDALEKQNQELLTEIRALREQLKTQSAPGVQGSAQTQAVEDRVAVAEERIKEQAETKVGTSQKFPLSLTGMFLFDAFLAHGTDFPTSQTDYADYSLGPAGGGATLRQSIIGIDFQGPRIFGDGRINGSLSLDFFHQSYGDDLLRVRRGTVSFDWARRSLTFGQDKSIIAPLQPTSFARVGVPPLSGAGNLWLWLPQIRYEERLTFSENTQATFQASLLETNESYSIPSFAAGAYYAEYRPAIQARFELRRSWAADSKFAVGVAGHASTSHILGQTIPSRVISTDVIYKPLRWLELSSTLLHGENFANLGGAPPGVTIQGPSVLPIHGTAGWMQVALPVTNRITFDIYAGLQANRSRDLSAYETAQTPTYAGNVLYRLAPNVVLGFEGAADRLQYLNGIAITANRYDATVAYLF